MNITEDFFGEDCLDKEMLGFLKFLELRRRMFER